MNASFNLSSATMLSKSEMKNVKGGISAEEYCATLREIIQHNELSDGAKEGAGYGWNRAGCGRFYNDVVL
jgi:hypothetical protein